MEWTPALIRRASQRMRDAHEGGCYTLFPWLPWHEPSHRAWNVRRGDRTWYAIHGSVGKDPYVGSCA
jgi:hypothetical protein